MAKVLMAMSGGVDSSVAAQMLQAEGHEVIGAFLRLGEGGHAAEKSKACCRALDCIECSGPRTFLRDGFPCIRYTNHYFVTTLLYSILLGFLGLDRCYCVHRVMVLTLQIIVLAQVLSRSHRDWSGETVNARWLGHLVGGGYLPPGHGSYSSR